MNIDTQQPLFLSNYPPDLLIAQNIVSLVGDRWTLSNPELSISVPAHLPSQAHLDLYAAEVIGNPFHDLNDFNLRWVAYSNWTYTSEPIQDLEEDAASTWLRFDGLDTFASIYFCNEFVAYTDNQFRQYWFDVTDIFNTCKERDRVLSINFGSAPLIANATAEAPGQETWPDGIQWTYEFANAHLIRKEHNDAGWDWGPAFAPAGPWLPVYVVQLLDKHAVHVRNANIDIYRHGQLPLIPPDQDEDWIIKISLDFFGDLQPHAGIAFILDDEEERSVCNGILTNFTQTETSITGYVKIDKELVDLWWPSALGRQTLYYLHIQLGSPRYGPQTIFTKRIGFRTIVLEMSPISEEQLSKGIAPGNNWKFEINGHEFYALGSNFIPPDPFWPNVTVERISQLFDSVIEGNQNMLRVWASGAYSPDFMYDLADERGILLWSEFEFGDHLYPVNAAFLENIRQEAEYQVRRVNHHPSLAVWAGGNELESLMLETARNIAPDQYHRFVKDYETLFIDTLGPAVFANSRSISYTPSSTSNGWRKLNFSTDPLHPFVERYHDRVNGSIYGNRDYYNYDPTVLGDLDRYPVGRFSNEFGMLSLPSIHSWRQQVSEDQLYLNSKVTTLRNHHEVPGGLNTSNFDAANVGQRQMIDAVKTWYPVPNKIDPIGNFSAWIYATQVYQADLYKSQIAFYRRGSGMPERQLGSLYWQLEDQWVAPTWAGIEYDGRWKMMQYATKDIYEPVIIAPYFNRSSGELTAYVTSALWETITGNATFTWYDWSGNRLDIDSPSKVDFEVGAINTTKVLDLNVSTTLQKSQLNNAVLRLEMQAEGHLPNDEKPRTFRDEHWFHPIPLRDAKLVNPGLQLEYSPETKNFTVTATKGVAAWVSVDYPSGTLLSFSSDAFWLAANESRELSARVWKDTTDGEWVHGVRLRSIWDLTTDY